VEEATIQLRYLSGKKRGKAGTRVGGVLGITKIPRPGGAIYAAESQRVQEKRNV